MRIQGDSMEPYIHDGSVVYVNHDPLRAGDVGIFCVDGDMLCKQYYRDPLGGGVSVQPQPPPGGCGRDPAPQQRPQPHLLRPGDAPRLAYTGIKKTRRKTNGFSTGTFFPRSHKIKPPSQVSTCPVMKSALSEARKATGVGDVLRRSQAAHGSFLQPAEAVSQRAGIQHIRADDARRHAVHPDVGGGGSAARDRVRPMRAALVQE